MTTTFSLSKEQFVQFLTSFAVKAKQKTISSSDIVLYNLVRGADPKRGFSPIGNPIKLSNGAQEWGGFDTAVMALKYQLKHSKGTIRQSFGADFLTDEILEQFRNSL